ncbi:MAG: hypothetical protein K5910_09955, partial [Bacteroidales bacterium]|nr:hypothetical protein [Bacteroidales bacterium]
TDKEKYTALMQRYWDAATTPEEERALALYAAGTDDPDFEEIRGVLGYLSVGKEKKERKARATRLYALAAVAAGIVAVAAFGLNLGRDVSTPSADHLARYAYGEFSSDPETIMASVDESLADFFGRETPAETNLIEMFKR